MKILIVNTSYSFFLYLLLKKDWKDTYFLFGKMFPRDIFSNLEKKSRCRYSGYGVLKSLTRDGKGKIYQFISYYYEIFYWHIYTLWLKLTVKDLEIYGNDSMDIALPFRDKFRYLIEDGTINYIDYQAPKRTLKEKIKLFFRGMYSTYIPFGKSKNIEKIYLTGIAEIPKSIEEKVEIIDLQKLWDSKKEEEKLEILEIFGFEKDILNQIKGRDEILLTQPLSEDEIMSEDEKLEIYNLPFRDRFRYLIEDGTINYIDYQAPQRTLKEKLKLFFRGMYSTYIPFGKSKNIEKIYLTGIAEIPKSIEEKVEIIDLQKLWDSKREDEKLEILEIFGFEKDILNQIKGRDEILLTQPLSEDEIMSEDEKLEIYKEIMKNYNSENMIIKTHPREKTDYRKHFPKALILDNVFPFEILLLMGIEFKRAVTIFSTAALGIGKDCKVDFYGTKINRKLLDKFGDISLESLNSK